MGTPVVIAIGVGLEVQRVGADGDGTGCWKARHRAHVAEDEPPALYLQAQVGVGAHLGLPASLQQVSLEASAPETAQHDGDTSCTSEAETWTRLAQRHVAVGSLEPRHSFDRWGANDAGMLRKHIVAHCTMY